MQEQERNLRASRHLERAMYYMGFGETCADVKRKTCADYNVGTDCMLDDRVTDGQTINDHHAKLLRDKCKDELFAQHEYELKCVNSTKGCTKKGWNTKEKLPQSNPGIFRGTPTQEQLMKMSKENTKNAVETGTIWTPKKSNTEKKAGTLLKLLGGPKILQLSNYYNMFRNQPNEESTNAVTSA